MTVPRILYCPECFRHTNDRPDLLCTGRLHTGQSQPAPWPHQEAS